jgi:uridylate kinase
MKTSRPSFRRIVLKLSGEALVGESGSGINAAACHAMAQSIQAVASQGVQVGLVIGGGNIFRALSSAAEGMARTPADQIGMLATVINGIALQQSLEALGCRAVILTALECPRVAEMFTLERALHYLNEGYVCLFVGGTGNPYFTTDTAAALRASEIQADALLKATKVDGVYDRDPLKDAKATKYQTITFSEVLAQKLEVMDATAIALCMKAQTPIVVFNMKHLSDPKLLTDLSQGKLGTKISGG